MECISEVKEKRKKTRPPGGGATVNSSAPSFSSVRGPA
jgi:hypothetical protein